MASKHLKDLLSEDQEPFVLKSHIDEKLHQLKQSVTTHKSHLQIKTRKPISQSSSISNNFRKNACFLSSSTTSCSASPDVRKSPLFVFKSPMKSPCRDSNALFFHIPARTAALLHEAALRIQKNSVSNKAKSRKKTRFGLFESILKRITSAKRNQKIESSVTDMGEKRVFVKDIIRWNSSKSNTIFTEDTILKEELVTTFEEDKMVSEMGFSCSCTSRLSSVWSESNEEKSFDLETSSSMSEDDSVNMEFLDEEAKNADFSSRGKEFCSSPFQVVLNNNCLSPYRLSPKFDTLATPRRSPNRINQQVAEHENQSKSDAAKIYEEEDKEQNSPVCVLDPPFEDDDDQDDEESEKCFELEHNFASIQRAKQQLLHNLRRFEILAELEPVDLVKRIDEEEEEDIELEEQFGDNDDVLLVRELLTQSNTYNHEKIPSDMQRLVLDLLAEEDGDIENVCKRLESWKEVDINTIDMMVGFDFRKDANEWAKNPEEMQETADDIEVSIFEFLVDELSYELVQ